MKKASILLSIFIFLLTTSFGQITFNRTYHFGVDVMGSILTTDSGYFTAISAGFPIYPRTTNLVYLDSIGNLINSNSFGTSSDIYNDRGLLLTYNGSLISGGFHYNSQLQKSFLSIRKWNSWGDTIWTRDFIPDSSKYYEGNFMCTTQDSGYCLAGFTEDTLTGDRNICCIKVDDNGNEVWYYELPTPNNDRAHGVIEHSNGSIYLTGTTRSFGHGNINESDAFLLKLDSIGQFQWIKTYGNMGPNDLFWGVEETRDHQLLIAGIKYNMGIDSYSGIWKLDTSGNVIWQNYYAYPSNVSELYWAHETLSGNIVATGGATNPILAKDDGWVLMTDSLGNKLWDRAFRYGSNHCYMMDSKQTTDKGFVIAGYVFDGASGNQDAWLVKIDSMGCDSAGCPPTSTGLAENHNTARSPVIFPNPCRDYLKIKVRVADEFDAVEVYSIDGRLQKSDFTNQRDFLQLNTSLLPAGIYVARLHSGNQSVTIRFAKE